MYKIVTSFIVVKGLSFRMHISIYIYLIFFCTKSMRIRNTSSTISITADGKAIEGLRVTVTNLLDTHSFSEKRDIKINSMIFTDLTHR